MYGYDFDRQRPIDRFIVDFFCKDLMLAIEIDGSSPDSEQTLGVGSNLSGRTKPRSLVERSRSQQHKRSLRLRYAAADI